MENALVPHVLYYYVAQVPLYGANILDDFDDWLNVFNSSLLDTLSSNQ